MKMKPILTNEDFKRVIKNGDLKNKTEAEVIQLMKAKKLSREDIDDVLGFCNENKIHFNKKPRTSAKNTEATQRVRNRMKSSNSLFGVYGCHIGDYSLLSTEEEKDLGRLIVKGRKANAELDYLEDNDIISTIPFSSILFLEETYGKSISELLTEYESELRSIASEGMKARERFINSNLRLAYSIAKKHKATGIDLEDLIQEANIGLMRAVDKYDPERGFRFATMASWWIEQAVNRGICNKSRAIRVPVHIWEKNQKIKKFERRYQQENGEKPSLQEYAVFLDCSLEQATHILSSMQATASLDKEIEAKKKDPLCLADVVVDKKNTEDVVDKQLLKGTISEILDDMNLQEEERSIFVNRFGLENTVPKTLSELGKMFNMKENQINRLISKILVRFQTPDRMNLLKDYYSEL